MSQYPQVLLKYIKNTQNLHPNHSLKSNTNTSLTINMHVPVKQTPFFECPPPPSPKLH